MGRCPWHEDATPSLSVDREKGLYNCFGCGESGDAFSLVEKMKGVSFREALEYLKARGAPAAALHSPSKPVVSRKPPVTPPEESPGAGAEGEADTGEREGPAGPTVAAALSVFGERLLDSVAEFYERELGKSREAQSYLEGRGLLSWEVLKRLGAGFSSGNLSAALGEGQKKELVTLNLLRGDGREALEGCFVVPLLDKPERSRASTAERFMIRQR